MMKKINDFKGKRVLVRCDFNVPLDDNGDIADDFKIKQTVPTLKYLQKKGAKLLLMSHRSDDKSLDSAWKDLAKYIDTKDITFLKNPRLDEREEANNDEYAKELSSLADIYVNDAFGVCHREHASVVAITKYLPSEMGLLLEKEAEALSRIIDNPKRPLAAVIGGAKIESKAKVIDKFLEIADNVLIGGKIGFDIKLKSSKLFLPVDYNNKLDIGPETIELFTGIIKKAKVVVWAGPMGRFEDVSYEEGTKKIAQAIIESKAFSVVGGGDTIGALTKLNLVDKFSHVSTGGGAMLAFLAGEELPGLKALGYYGNKEFKKGGQ